ncbi:lysosomal alpha-glucosidase [Capsaspora owczarzaki ATCC 30864]|uniref:Lysosomal alpha-glucosidase n=1 Tax=Capsaspora owczarzaki (strain ATCC 30864) TaxID=595528 RepID=A0A0D2VSP8_CAPO3|nr:lysosomal alpha-glucosidase [Capsaspora owczarzaki ATCC 30864]KJE94142.1 lysosomal alpha-glucosidase [Capsaspora owczarzaki ATCC 30864]|eukprot:XP_004347578.2 lysosomal alpha-glucosidase [Capsaspora owczarzaki ATCC 30864]
MMARVASSLSALLVLGLVLAVSAAPQCNPGGVRNDCGYVGITQQQCEAKGCCWSPLDNNPWCFNSNPPQSNYVVKSIAQTSVGYDITLTLVSAPATFGPDVVNPKVSVSYDTADQLRVRIVDSDDSSRWEVPTWLSPLPPPPTKPAANPNYVFSTAPIGQPFWFAVSRASDGKPLFNTSSTDATPFNNMVFEDQYLEISTQLPSTNYIYGIGEHVQSMRLTPDTYTLWAYDTPTPVLNNLYGAHPFYIEQRADTGKAHGVFFRNSNGQDVTLSGTSLTFRSIGGIFDFFFFMGPTPEAIVQQYTSVIGRPHMPPFWGLGFHQCRYGYKSLSDLQTVVAQYKANQIPLDTMWTDIDYMDSFKDFTWDPVNFPQSGMLSFVNSLHANKMQYVVIVDPGLANQPGYAPYDQGEKLNLFVKTGDGVTDFVGKVWPGLSVFPDFFNPSTAQFWQTQIQTFLAGVPVDGLWIDMNEISNFCNGECDSATSTTPAQAAQLLERLATSPPAGHMAGFNPVSPPYAIDNQQQHQPLNIKTLDMTVQHYGGVLEYDAHNLFGLSEALATDAALEVVRKQRSFVISRSTFPGSGRATGHWTGDNHATWDDLYYSIPGMINFQMFGIPLVGSDICGFLDDTTEELCGRWMQLGAFYPFSRNHNTLGAAPQEPYTWPSVAAISRTVLGIRYSLLSYYYSLFYLAHVQGTTVIRPLFFEFGNDTTTYTIDRQFLVGNALLVTPVLTQGASTVSGYFPQGVWYDWYTLSPAVGYSSIGSWQTLNAPFNTIPLHLRGGSIVPIQNPALVSADAHSSDFTLLVATNSTGSAQGFLFLDDGTNLAMTSYVSVTYSAAFGGAGASGQLTNQVTDTGYGSVATQRLATVKVLGVTRQTTVVSLNSALYYNFTWDAPTQVLTITNLQLPISAPFVLYWAPSTMTEAADAENHENGQSTSLQAPAIAGIVVGCLAVVALAKVIVRRRKSVVVGEYTSI